MIGTAAASIAARQTGAASQSLYDWAPVADWLSWARDFFSPALLRALALQLGLIAVVFAVSWLLRGWTRTALDPIAARFPHSERVGVEIRHFTVMVWVWLLLVAVDLAAESFEGRSCGWSG